MYQASCQAVRTWLGENATIPSVPVGRVHLSASQVGTGEPRKGSLEWRGGCGLGVRPGPGRGQQVTKTPQ